MTRGQMKTEVQVAIGARTDRDAQISNGLDMAIKEMVKRHAFKQFWVPFGPLAVNPNDICVTLPGTILHLIEARLLQDAGLRGKRLAVKNKGWVTQRIPDVTQLPSSEPWLCYYEGAVLNFAPPANKSYTIVGTIVTVPANYASDNIENPIPFSDQTQIAYATAYVKRLLNQHDQAQQWMATFEQNFASDLKNDQDRKANELAMDDFSMRAQYDGFPNQQSQPWLDPFVGQGSLNISNKDW